jgi:hypothetical protein
MGSKQANTFKTFFPINHNDKQFTPIPVKENKPPLIDIADILAYAAAHSLSATYTKDKQFHTAMLGHTIGYSEAIFINSEVNSGATCSIRVPNTHIEALKKYVEDAS